MSACDDRIKIKSSEANEELFDKGTEKTNETFKSERRRGMICVHFPRRIVARARVNIFSNLKLSGSDVKSVRMKFV
jgi:hypothetical protein